MITVLVLIRNFANYFRKCAFLATVAVAKRRQSLSNRCVCLLRQERIQVACFCSRSLSTCPRKHGKLIITDTCMTSGHNAAKYASMFS